MAESLAGTDPDRERELLRQVQRGVKDALEDLRDLARGIYPPLLADQGLQAALEAQARKVSMPVSVETDGIGRYPQEFEATVYFCVLEALQNASKYAGASEVSVRVWRDDGDLVFSVVDDGRGFDRGTTTLGTGMRNMADRLAAVGGSLEVSSQPGGGTTVSGRIPIPSVEPR
jgi:signal transduction histidine kinase